MALVSDDKHLAEVVGHACSVAEFSGDDPVVSEKKGTFEDVQDMRRLGKRQELRRNFRFVSIFGYSMVLMATWETMLSTAAIGLLNGGTAGAIWMYIATAVGMIIVILSLAEMASMAPTSGGQYHWVSEFAPREYQRILSYTVGWLCVLGWQTGIASIGYLAGTQIQGLIAMNHPNYVFERWHGTLLVIGIATFSIVFNTVLARKLPLVEGTVLILHIFGFVAVVVVLWTLAPLTPASKVFTEFQDNAGWGSIGLSCLIGMLAPVFGLLGSDAATHMSEELKDASRTLPRAMIWTACVNSAMGLVMLITLMTCLGDVDSIMTSPSGYPFIQVFYNSTGSLAATNVLTFVTITMATFGCVNNVATSSRQLFAFARDQGVPFASFLAHVRPGWDIPLNAVMVSFVIAVLLSLINIGSTVAFNSIVSLGVGALICSYIVSCSCMLLKRWRNERLLPCKFSLGRAGFAINLIAVLFLILVFVMSFFPVFPHPDATTMNWSIVIYGAVMIFSVVYYFVKGRHQYAGPVEYVRKDL